MAQRTKNKIIGLKDLRENMEKYIRAVDAGASLTVIRRSTPVFRLTPVAEDESLWEPVVDFTTFDPEGIPANALLKRLKALNGSNR